MTISIYISEEKGKGSTRKISRFVLIQSFEFIHSVDRGLWFSDEVGLTAGRIEVRVADVGEVEGSDAGGVDEEIDGGEVGQQGGQGGVVAADEVDAFG